jgi:5-methylcytosine-specific restriction protein B
MKADEKNRPRVSWSEEHTKSVLDLYLRTSGDKSVLDDNDEEVIKESRSQKRSAASIAYKLKNFRFLDPRGETDDRRGLEGFSKQDVICWKQYSGFQLSKRAIERIGEKGWTEFLDKTGSLGISPTNLSNALLTKPFLILTGPSGTGKTRGARRLAKVICGIDAHSLVAVGADWTDNRHVLGYLNPLESVEVKNDQGVVEAKFPIYETTPILELILHALDPAHRDEPHVLILDEMNLSHVERYFADFLSAMELQDKTDALKLHTAGMARSREGNEIPGTIDFPTNLFVIGTVNIDETTYMFSPKVLDRANVIEIHAGETQMENFLKGIDADDTGEEAKDYGISFLDAARAIQTEEENDHVPPLPSTVRDVASDHLMALFRIMARGRTEYGFRTGKEVKAYLRTAHFLAGPEPAAREAWSKIGTTESPENGDWIKALDAQILQKILPKLHGSRTRLAPLLGALATYCATGEETYAMEHFPDDGAMAKRVLKDATGASSQKFPESYKKLERMIEVLMEEQFVSFIC